MQHHQDDTFLFPQVSLSYCGAALMPSSVNVGLKFPHLPACLVFLLIFL